ncbi:succinoglycan biosynthesis protein ExoA [Meinhardsimonia xiamenensis]|uniref:Succinoglycan biosynthesis protein ExoA n=1 Tax=Meinhardsimonia xiamenensis TaxID=990712 RepID=A0A1G9E618_9RHOB|nr:glycosyltransferase [Meinhardsimonia xiamenensis]PRX33913.1 succinoglycan biosynthesis protein ExoA [Meinhardsimonia xiamenensis]SDK71507.1 succinoglycan biosynthesis protein ExoA [Meinhardsimonia xiamenensis]
MSSCRGQHETWSGDARGAAAPCRAPEAVVVIPTLDEEQHISAVLDGIRADDAAVPVLVVDGGSRDATPAIVRRRMGWDSNLYLLRNPRRLQAAGVNLGALVARDMGARILLRLDAHARYPKGFIPGVLAALRQSGADSVVVPLIAAGAPGWQAAAAALQRSWLGHGGAAHRRGGRRGWVEHGHHAAFRLETFLRLGGYDADLPACEDVEFDMRLCACAGRIWMEDRWPVSYRPRSSPGALWRQMRRNGHWRLTVARARGQPLRARQLLPLAATGGAAASLLAGLFVHPALALPAAGYLGLVLALSLAAAGIGHARRVFLLAVLSHTAYAVGMLGAAMAAAASRSARTVHHAGSGRRGLMARGRVA